MSLWKVLVLDTSDNTEKSFRLKAESYTPKRIIEILLDVHPEYDNIRVESVDVPPSDNKRD